MSYKLPSPTIEADLNSTQCKVQPSVMVGKLGRCHKRDSCRDKRFRDCGEVLSLNKKLEFLKEANALRKVI